MLDSPALVCFDLPCLLTPRPDAAREALDRALLRVGLDREAPMYRSAHTTRLTWPGSAARAELGHVFGSDVWADCVTAAYDDAFGAASVRSGVTLADGAVGAVSQLRARGARICLTTEFSSSTREALLDALGWHELVAMLVSADQVGGGRPSAVHEAIARADADPARTAVVTSSLAGVTAGRAAGAGCVVGLLGGVPGAELRGAGADVVSTLPALAARWAQSRLVPA